MKGNFKNIINSNTPVLVDFHAVWCGPCRTQGPIIDELAKEVGNKARIIKIDIDKNQQIANQYQIRSVPTIALFKNGVLLWKESGVQTKNKLQDIIKKHS